MERAGEILHVGAKKGSERSMDNSSCSFMRKEEGDCLTEGDK